MLTIQQLKEMEPGKIFACGEVFNSPDGLFMSNSDINKKMIWAAKRGRIHDWAIYIHWAEKGLDYVITNGDKVTSIENIQKLVPSDEGAIKMYRY